MLNNPVNESIPKLNEVFHVLQPIQSRWYELFFHLGIERTTLEDCYTDHPYDDRSSLIRGVVLWLQRTDPPPSWRDLVDVVEYHLLEGHIAAEIKRNYCLELDNKFHERIGQ